jgi:hypothetical protein
MPAIGSRGSYAVDKPVQDTIGDAMKYTEQMAFKYREEDEKKKAAIAKAKEEQEKLLKPLDDKVTYTPYDSDNAMRFDLANKLRTRIDQASNDVRKGKISQQDWNLINANAKATLDFVNQGAANINTQATNVAKLAAEGKLAKGSVDEALRLGGAVDNRRINFEINPDGTANTILFDENNQIIEKGGIDKVGSTIYNPVYNVDFDTELQQFKTANPIDFTETLLGTRKVGVKELTPRLKSTIDRYAEAKLADKDALINAYYNETGIFKKDITSPEDIALAKKYIVEKFEGSYNKELTVDEATQRANLARQKAQDDKDKVKITDFKFDNYRKDDFVNIVVDPKTVYTNGVSFTKPIAIANLGGENSGLNMAQVLGFTKDKTTGDIVFTGKALKTKNAKFVVGGKTVDYSTVSELAAGGDSEAQAALASYNVPSNYGNFTRRLPSEDEANVVLGAVGLDYAGAIDILEKKNPTAKKSTTKPKANTQQDFNAKWAKLKPGETLVGPDGKTYKKK